MDIKEKHQTESLQNSAEILDSGYSYKSISIEKSHSSTTQRVGFPSWINIEHQSKVK